MAVRKLKLVEANDGSYAGLVLAAFDRLEAEALAKKAVADLMREWRNVAGLSTEQAGARVGLSARAIEDIEQGRRRAGDELTALGLKKLIETEKTR